MRGALPWKTILVPYDFSASADHALAIALDEARAHRAALIIAHIVELMPQFGPDTTLILPDGAETPVGIHHHARERAAQDLRAVVDKLAADVPVEIFIGEGNPVTELNELARREDVDLIVMGTHGRTGLRRLVAGSIAERLVRTSEVPVLTTRHPD